MSYTQKPEYFLLPINSVSGVNLEEAESAPRVIKTWDERLSDEGVASGVDDDVS